ncbi:MULTISPECIES: type II toxin-antitoxin system VapC family toxin [unclassified Neorhizobium]|uniref:type II toxin-antitoxin system VapC family toxin n=1 Tax=unclassified Neorhizobium TaxID=2629175 RepID=UPI001FF25776|nr:MULTISPECIES: type II toxin-antitoxin system VapC family toxin [unclassified Neorhizobium]MCJ9669867.1 type II toxin-antitoxin system VapC family toxin [Neorhizobium sp. SHOUNA12B]MCJ9746733.1 type II toxin-antitoxin system VapC family toxin [Neorhizobium sp. SHOUNA12A]
MSSRFLLDTCFVIWMSQKEVLSPVALESLGESQARRIPVFVSAATAWEMGMLLAKGRIRESRDAQQWYRDYLRDGNFTEHPVTSTIFIASSFLPQPIHKDPIDRILIATAREHDLTIITRDRAILSYGHAGHVRTLAC